MPDENGVSLRQHLEQAEKATGIRDERLDSVRVPRGFESIWKMFWDLFSGGNPPTIMDIKSYIELMGLNCSRIEFIMLIEMLKEYNSVMAEITREKLKR